METSPRCFELDYYYMIGFLLFTFIFNFYISLQIYVFIFFVIYRNGVLI